MYSLLSQVPVDTVTYVTNHDVVWQALIAAIVTVVLAWMQQRTKASVEKVATTATESAAQAAVRAKQVKDALATETAATARKLEQVKTALVSETAATSRKLEQVKQTLDLANKETVTRLDEVKQTVAEVKQDNLISSQASIKVDEIHVMVNGQRTALLQHIEILNKILDDNGIPHPTFVATAIGLDK